jgi:pilus assembly protein Flp/PilA
MIQRIAKAAHDAMYGLLPQEREECQGMAEYGLILSGVALLAIVAVFLLGPQIGKMLNKVNASLS